MVPHTTTGEWQSFEMRMRRRRAGRLVLRAEAAMEAGCLDDARQCLMEARTLDPTVPALDDVERKLSEPVPSVQRQTTPRHVAAAVVLLAVAGTAVLGGWKMMSRPTAAGEPVTATAPAPATDPSPARTAAAPLPPPAVVFAFETAPAPTTGTTVPTQPSVVPARLESAEPRAQVPLSPLQVSQFEALSVPPQPPVAAPAPSLPATPEPAPVAAFYLPAAARVVAPVPEAEPAPAEPSQEPAVRAVLDRYASAFSSLDVEEAQRVWPGVNRGALARAFDSLASQQVSLGECRIDVIGASATARCAGTTSWSPKVGDGAQRTEARAWAFELARGSAGWEIVSARVQNR